MENDIEIQQLAKINSEKDEKLRKMKSNIQKLQMNMNKKREIPSYQINNIKKQPITSYNNIKNDYLPNEKPYEKAQEFGYNSNLFKQLNNQSQGVLQNGSAVSNFSSISNINNFLNAANNIPQTYKPQQTYQHSKQIQTKYNNAQSNTIINKNPSRSSNEPNLLDDIDRLLQKTKNTKKSTSLKDVQKYIEIKQSNQSKIHNQSSSFNHDKIAMQDGQNNMRVKLNQYKRFIDNLGPIKNQSDKDKYQEKDRFKKTEDNYQRIQIGGYKKPTFQTLPNFKSHNYEHTNQVQKVEPPSKPNQSSKKHKQHQPSNITNKSQYLYSYSKTQHPFNNNESTYSKMPPTPPLSNRKPSNTLVERQKEQIKSSIQQYKKLQNQIHHDQNVSQIDFQLSDDQSSEQKPQENTQKSQKISKLLEQKQSLLKELQSIDKQLQELQNSI